MRYRMPHTARPHMLWNHNKRRSHTRRLPSELTVGLACAGSACCCCTGGCCRRCLCRRLFCLLLFCSRRRALLRCLRSSNLSIIPCRRCICLACGAHSTDSQPARRRACAQPHQHAHRDSHLQNTVQLCWTRAQQQAQAAAVGQQEGSAGQQGDEDCGWQPGKEIIPCCCLAKMMST